MAMHQATTSDRIELDHGFRKVVPVATFIGGAGVLLAGALCYFADGSLRHFYFSYLISYLFFLAITLGALFFVILQQLVKAGWSVGVRRTAESIVSALPVMGVLAAPIVVSVWLNNGELYRWAQPLPKITDAEHVEERAATPEEAQAKSNGPHGVLPLNEEILAKRVFLNPIAFTIRMVVYFVLWSLIGVTYWRTSIRQDNSDDPALSLKMQSYAAPCMVIFALTFTLAAFDLIMSLDPTWYSTMFGVYYFAGCAISVMATLILVSRFLQARGMLVNAISTEHYHDMGKLLFAFTFFWGYIGFSQYMLQWYGNIPEETAWWARRGASSATGQQNSFTLMVILLPICHLFVPFAGLLSRHIKRNRNVLAFWAAWMLVFCWMDFYWLVMPEFDGRFHFGLLEPLCFFGIGGFWLSAVTRVAIRHPLLPIHDPRLPESLAFQNI